jgi:hypothetical protein
MRLVLAARNCDLLIVLLRQSQCDRESSSVPNRMLRGMLNEKVIGLTDHVRIPIPENLTI